MSTEDIGARLREAGVPREAFSTNLLKEKKPELRAYVQEGVYKEKSILYTFPGSEELAHYLVAKELILSGVSVVCLNLVDVHTALFRENDEAELLMHRIEHADVLAINGFYDVGGFSSAYFTPYEVAYFTSWFIRRHQNDKGFLLHGRGKLNEVGYWWPQSFVAYINKRSITHQG